MANVVRMSSDADTRYRILIDTDILEEVVLNRGSFAEDVEKLLEASNSPIINLYVTDRGLARIQCNYDEATSNYFRNLFKDRLISVSHSIREKARWLNFADYESAIEHICAEEGNFDAICTLNPSNFSESSIPIWAVSDLMQRISLEQNRLDRDRSPETLLIETLLIELKNMISVATTNASVAGYGRITIVVNRVRKYDQRCNYLHIRLWSDDYRR